MDPTPIDPQRANDDRRRRLARRCLWVLAVLLAYPLAVLGATYAITLSSGLPGGSHGPCDAYRHALASALVAYTLSPSCVEWVTEFMEGDDAEASHVMDSHNNRVGIRMAASAANLADLLAKVRRAVEGGAEIERRTLSDRRRIVWLPEEEWANAWW